MKKYIVFFMLSILLFPIHALDLTIGSDDLRLESRADGGFNLFIRKKPDIYSVLLTESTRDPAMRADNFAYRAREWNPVNGDEIRLLNGVPIPRESGIFSLISSTPVSHPELGQAFHIFLPYVLYYGYAWSRHGRVILTDGTFLNIRAFELPFADYRGAFRDNPFVLEARQEPPPGIPEGHFLPEAVVAFTEIARAGGGSFIHAAGPDDTVNIIRSLLEQETGSHLDLVICIDTTGSMRRYIDAVRERLIPMLNEILSGFPSFRIGMVRFKDYGEAYLTRVIPFTTNFTQFQRELNAIRAFGGGDIPEAVYEALYDGATRFPWEAEARVMILIGDAPPHPTPRGRITGEMAKNAAAERNIRVHAILMPQ